MSIIMVKDVCKNCKFNRFPRSGDITIGDFWGIGKIDPRLDDGHGTSLVIINSDKGELLFSQVKEEAKVCVEIDRTSVVKTPNRIDRSGENYFLPFDKRDDFRKMLDTLGFSKTLDCILHEKYDVGIVTALSYNYGGNLTYFALYSVLCDLGLSSIFIDRRKDVPAPPHSDPYRMFNVCPYPNFSMPAPATNLNEISKYNDQCKAFVLGSD